MVYDFHLDKKVYFDMQYQNAKEYIVPFINKNKKIEKGMHVLEIGCGEGGVMKAFTEIGCNCLGIELVESRIEWGKKFMHEELQNGFINFISRDIYQIDTTKDIGYKFDIIVLKDTIEHIPNQAKLIQWLHEFLNPEGVIFFGFPPWAMPFGGHQQICEKKLTSKMPYYHILPEFLYKGILKMFGERQTTIGELMEVKSTGISINRFQRIVKKTGFSILDKQLYFINPIYKYKFNIKPKLQNRIIRNIPYLRDFFITTAYYLIQTKKGS